jgi:phosphoglycolate phosphatase
VKDLVVLWDIDGTLLSVHGAGRRAFAVALSATWERPFDLDGVSFAGATDLGILGLVLGAAELDGRRIAAFFDALERALDDELRRAPARAFPGAHEATRTLAELGVAQGLLTGNEERCARRKLRSAGFDPGQFPFGAFGHQHADRDELARRAAAQRRGRMVVVGDTPRDVQAARAIGALAVAVASGFAPRDSLEAAAPDQLLDDLTGLVSILERWPAQPPRR